MINKIETCQLMAEWEDELSSMIDAEDIDREYLILHDYTNEMVEHLSEITGFTYINYVMIDGDECAIISRTDEKVWLDYDIIDEYWDGCEWIEVEY